MLGHAFRSVQSVVFLVHPQNTRSRRAVEKLGAVGPGQFFFDPKAFAAVNAVRFGTSGRNILRGPHRTNLDASIFKEIPIAERYRVQFRGEFFNALNHPQFDLPNATIGSAAAGIISSTVGSPRDIQLSLRLMFQTDNVITSKSL